MQRDRDFLVVFGVLDITALARQLVRRGIHRTAYAAIEEERLQRPVARLPEGRSCA